MGELVVTELDGSAPEEQWLELYNASGATLDLTGVRVTLTKLDGSNAETFVVQEGEQPPMAAGEYAVLRTTAEFPSGAGVDLVSCGRTIDRMIYRNLPNEGSYAFTGLIDPPDHAENDVEEQWCIDLEGSPGERNPTCPE